ncbi:RHS repeat domain-containing protein [Cellulomonas sp. URHD0024]|uniref:RHS repeat domain-containing protein n=1 Tax=Cellulomonas sp. URHD0024 TaxID=1302620 RepID=UPI000403CCC4|nr:RHS repeat-associated core domain-containing protein [Cellulomonas sp. URHD0024]
MRGRWGFVVGVSAVALVGAALPAVAASPAVPTGLAVERAVTYAPVLAATVSDPDGGVVSAQFFARRLGSATWNLANGTAVAVTSGQVARLALPTIPSGTTVEWQVKGCDAGSCSALTALQTATVSPMLGAGGRKNATALPFQVGDRTSAKVDVGTGNLLVSADGLTVPGVNTDIPVQLAYNSLSLGAGVPQASSSNATGFGWTVSFAARLEFAADGSVVFWGPSGLSGTFVPKTGGGYTPPGGLTADLTHLGATWTVTDHQSAQVLTFNAAGVILSIADRNGNTSTITYDPYVTTRPTAISATRGTSGLGVSLGYTSNRLTKLSQGPAGSVRSVALAYDGYGDLATLTDAAGRVTTFSYSAHQLTKIAAPGGIDTRFTFDARNRVTSIRQVNSTAGSPGDTWTRLAYVSDSQVLVSDGSQEQAGSPATGPHTTYTLSPEQTGRVASAQDAQGRSRSATFTANFDPLTTTQGASATTTYTYGANGGESLTGQTAPTGSARGWGYSATPRYLPTSSTVDGGAPSTYTYNGAGNPLTSADATAAKAVLTRNIPDGTVATATAPGNGTNSTKYTYTNAQLTKITPVTGSNLGVRDFTYDTYGRLKTSTDGRAVTTTYSYDVLDRVTGTDYSGTAANPDVSFTYDSAGRLSTRTDAAGTTTTTYDQVSNVRTRKNTFDNKTITYTYDKAGRLASTTDTGGPTNYTYDTAGALVSMQYPAPAGWPEDGLRGLTVFAVDSNGRRTDTWMRADAAHTRWAVHSHTDFDASGRATRILGERKHAAAVPGAPATTVVDLSYCYAAGSTYPTCPTTRSADRSLVQWSRNNVTGQLTTYTYDSNRRLTGAATTAGTGPGGTPIPAAGYTYAYDVRGNRTSAVVTGASPSTQTRTFNAANQTTTAGFAYDGAGNLTADPTAGTIAYTAGDQMASVTRAGKTYTYTYAGTGNDELLSQTVPSGGTYSYTYGAGGSAKRPVIQEIKVSNGTAHLDNDPTGQPIQIRTSTGQDAMYIYDALGSPVALITNFDVNAFQYAFDPYGISTLTETSGGNGVPQTPFLYTGGLVDRTTGWIKNSARYYNPAEGRWTQGDARDTPLDPANANHYAYAADNPINYVDPSGADACSLAAGLTGVGVAGVLGTGSGFLLEGAVFGAATISTAGATLIGAGIAAAVGVGFVLLAEAACE